MPAMDPSVISGGGCRRYRDRVCLVTGGSAGIGLGIASAFVSEGGRVIICGRSEPNLKKAAEELNDLASRCGSGGSAIGLVCDVSDRQKRASMIDSIQQKYGRLDVLVSNVAASPDSGARFVDLEESVLDRQMELNVKCTWMLIKEGLPLLRKSTLGPCILIVSSIIGYQNLLSDSNKIPGYTFTKTILLGMTKLVGRELLRETPKIRVNCLAPGIIDTAFAAPLVANPELVKASIKMGRVGKIEEMGRSAAFLCSDDASFMTTETLIAAGGTNSRL